MDLVTTFFNWPIFVRSLPLLLDGLWRTIALGFLSIVLGLAGGLMLALGRMYGPRFLKAVIIAYVDVFRALPVLVWLVIVYYALPFVGISLSPFASAAFALTTVSSAYTAEIYRAGIDAIPRGQFEAAQAIGLLPGTGSRSQMSCPFPVRRLPTEPSAFHFTAYPRCEKTPPPCQGTSSSADSSTSPLEAASA